MDTQKRNFGFDFEIDTKFSENIEKMISDIFNDSNTDHLKEVERNPVNNNINITDHFIKKQMNFIDYFIKQITSRIKFDKSRIFQKNSNHLKLKPSLRRKHYDLCMTVLKLKTSYFLKEPAQISKQLPLQDISGQMKMERRSISIFP